MLILKAKERAELKQTSIERRIKTKYIHKTKVAGCHYFFLPQPQFSVSIDRISDR